MSVRLAFAWIICLSACLPSGCRKRYRDDLDYSYAVEQVWPMEDLNFGEIVQFESVFWEPDDTVSLRKMIVEDAIADGRDVLEIGTGTGLISVLCLQNESNSVVATDINPAAVANAKYNAAVLASDSKLDVRQVSVDAPGAFSVIKTTEKFDLILSNPPWEDGQINQPADHAFFDPGFELMDTLLDGLPKHLKPGGRCLLAYGHVPAIKRLRTEAQRRGYQFKVLDDRDLDSLTRDFLPGMLVEIRVAVDRTVVSGGGFQQVDAAGDAVTDSDPADAENPATATSQTVSPEKP